MKTPLNKLIIACGLTLTMAQFSHLALAESASQNTNEVRQSAQISTAFALSPFLRAHDLEVVVKGDKAILTGKVEGEVNKDLASEIALGVKGIKDVENKITVDENYEASKKDDKDRSFGEVVDDATITASIKSKLLWSKFAEGLSTNVDTEAGKVTLKGTADTEVNKELAERLAMNTKGVSSVDNQLKVKNEKASLADKTKSSMSSAGQAISDTWITTKVKSSLMYSSNVNGSQISVDTKNGIVTLSGTVNSGAERELAIEIAENVRGTKSVKAKELKELKQVKN